MPQISIVIVSYNVKNFLRECLQSVEHASANLETEVFVVDNNSVDGSSQMVQAEFPWVKLIANNFNSGFSKANNQALKEARGEYILILNPDTILGEETLEDCMDTMAGDSEIGALGVKMLDGSGVFLPESKRGLPGLWSSLCKFTGLYKLFPKSNLFNDYYQGHLSQDGSHEVDVLSGAFMFMRKTVLDSIGYFDEQFFMYGEDIDLSYRVKKAGFKNWYLGDTSIIHFKGESTKKSSVSYTKNFYNAMRLFNNKHSNSSLFPILINILIVAIGISAYLKRIISPVIHYVFDFVIVGFTYIFVSKFWANFYFNNEAYYGQTNFYLLIFVFALFYGISLFIAGHYEKKSSIVQLISGWFAGSIVVFVCYSFLPESIRFSRFIVLLSSVIILPSFWIVKALKQRFQNGSWKMSFTSERKILLVGNAESVVKIRNNFEALFPNGSYAGSVSPDNAFNPNIHVARLEQIEETSRVLNPSELVFCSQDILNTDIFKTISNLGSQYTYRISNKENGLIGSDSKDQSGFWQDYKFSFKLNQQFIKRQKRILDLILCFGVLLFSPVWLIFSSYRIQYLKGLPLVFLNRRTWVGYTGSSENAGLPKLKTGVFDNSIMGIHNASINPKMQNLEYAQNYTVWKDFQIVMSNIFN